jgi:hypothetical protein
LSVGPLTFTRFSQPARAGLGIALHSCGRVVAALLRLCWWTAKALLMVIVLLVAIVAGWFNRDGRSAPGSTVATFAPDDVR